MSIHILKENTSSMYFLEDKLIKFEHAHTLFEILTPTEIKELFVLDGNELFSGLRSTMTSWEFVALKLCPKEVKVEAKTIYYLTRRPKDDDAVYHGSHRAIGPGAHNYEDTYHSIDRLIKWDSDYSDELFNDITPKNKDDLLKYAKKLVKHGNNKKTVLQKGTEIYSKLRRDAAKAFFRHLIGLIKCGSVPKDVYKQIFFEFDEESGVVTQADLNRLLANLMKCKALSFKGTAFFKVVVRTCVLWCLFGSKTGPFVDKALCRTVLSSFASLKNMINGNSYRQVKTALIFALEDSTDSNYVRAPWNRFYLEADRERMHFSYGFYAWRNLLKKAYQDGWHES